MISLITATILAMSILIAAEPANAAAPVGPGTYEEGSSDISYAGSWTTMTSSSSSGGFVRFATSPSASASLQFTGTMITWYTWNSASAGIVHVYLDGAKVATVDNYSAESQTGIIGYRIATDPGTHTIKIVGSGSANSRSSGRITHLDSFVVSGDNSGRAIDPAVRASDCPSATVSVSTTAQLNSALAGAGPGTVIRLADGYYTYPGGFVLRASGTESRPIWICGSPNAIIEGRSISEAGGLRLERAEHVRVAGFTIARVLQGILVKFGSDVAISDMTVKDTGYEAIHLYAFTTDSIVTNNTIARTGVVDVAYGEGVYIGTSQRRWADVTGGVPDRSDGNAVVYNSIKTTGAEGIEAKEGTSGGLIAYNTFEGHQDDSRAWAWVLINGNDWTVRDNSGVDAVDNAYASMAWDVWGQRNRFTGNTGDADAPGYGVWVQDRRRGVEVACDNSIRSAGEGLTNVYCVP